MDKRFFFYGEKKMTMGAMVVQVGTSKKLICLITFGATN
jgi:hypothetical protein